MRSGLRTDLRAVARAEQLPEDLITASPKRRLIFSFNQTLKENVSMAQFQWKRVCLDSDIPPALFFFPARSTIWKFQG